MRRTNQLDINELKYNTVTKSLTTPLLSNTWLAIKDIKDASELSQIYNHVCRQHQEKNKWILFINPENNSLIDLAKQHKVDTSKILQVTTKHGAVNVKHIKTALSKGHCAAIILPKTGLAQTELTQLNQYAQQGKTQCIVLNNELTLH